MSSIPSPVQVPAPGRKPVITREDIVAAALKLVGPQRSVSSLSLREVAREAGIAPNSFYRHFHDMDELAVALIELAGRSLRDIIGSARSRARTDASVVRSSIEVFVAQLRSDDRLLHILLREGNVGSDAFKQAVERQLTFFEEELTLDLVRLARAERTGLYEPALTARAITRLVFAIAATAMDQPADQQAQLTDQLIQMVRMIVAGTQTLAAQARQDAQVAVR
ncbi:HTH-type transcriptional repressor FabR [Aquabacterium sp.]|jgi:TetR/AcrR family transcriptional regulator, fatty acid biosynthesis regulator|uniref:HTH-type transcriptional repressor FabR n=1 Tax=Aquabacterium sp. TaxID=1872578 RepID=UPI0024885E6C|nr:HTH-type transcriptional repressor FabR [Aquabacterium sp.]MDI1348773.1 HTH-type transcriptional repressor FabR [Aquabacterium sp.]